MNLSAELFLVASSLLLVSAIGALLICWGSHMNRFVKFLLVCIGVILITAIATPIIFENSDFKFTRIINRCIMALTFVAVGIAMKGKWHELWRNGLYGLVPRPGCYTWLWQGIATGILMLLSLTIVESLFGARLFQLHPAFAERVIPHFLKFAISALVIGVIEEFFFRGLVYTSCTKAMPVAMSLIVTNAFYSIVHFIQSGLYRGYDPTMVDSLIMMTAMLKPLLTPLAILPGVIGLFIFGMALSYTVLRTKSLYLAIGLHAGCVFFLKMDGLFVTVPAGVNEFIFGQKNFYSGIVGWGALFLLFVFLVWWLRKVDIQVAAKEDGARV